MQSKQLSGIATVFLIVGIVLPAGQSGTAAEATDIKTDMVDLEYGQEINETCAACHGEFGEGMPDGEYPRLAGLPQGYIAKQLRDFYDQESHRLGARPLPARRV